MEKEKTQQKRGPREERLILDGSWTETVKKAIGKKCPVRPENSSLREYLRISYFAGWAAMRRFSVAEWQIGAARPGR